MRTTKHWWIAVVVVAAVAIAGGTWWLVGGRSSSSGQQAASATSVTQPVTLGTVSRTVAVSGTFNPTHIANLNFASSGTVTAVDAVVGQQVTAGEALASVGDTELKAEVTADQASLTAAQSQLTTAQAAADSTQISGANAQVTAAQAKLTSAQQAVTDATLRSTINGTVASVDLVVGDQVSGSTGSGAGSGSSGGGSGSANNSGGSAGNNQAASGSSSTSSAQVVVVDTSSWTVNASVSAADLASIKKGQQATVSVATSTSGTSGRQAFGAASGNAGSTGRAGSGTSGTGGTTGAGTTSAAQYTGTVTSIGLIASTASSTVATFPVTIVLDGAHTGLYDGTSATADITTSQQSNVLSVPTAAISTSSAGKPTVTVMQGTSAKQVTVTVGGVYGSRTQIRSGVSAGQLVVVASRNAFGTKSSSRSGTTGGGGFGGGFGGGGNFPGRGAGAGGGQ